MRSPALGLALAALVGCGVSPYASQYEGTATWIDPGRAAPTALGAAHVHWMGCPKTGIAAIVDDRCRLVARSSNEAAVHGRDGWVEEESYVLEPGQHCALRADGRDRSVRVDVATVHIDAVDQMDLTLTGVADDTGEAVSYRFQGVGHAEKYRDAKKQCEVQGRTPIATGR